jgi:hypothetical protein
MPSCESSAGDVNGDGLDDLIVNAWSADPDNKLSAGKSYVVFGKQNNTDAINHWRLTNHYNHSLTRH